MFSANKCLVELGCSFFCLFQRLSSSADNFSDLSPNSSICTESFEEEIKKLDLSFNSTLITLLDKISHSASENYNERILNIIHRLDFNGFYLRALDTFNN